MYAEELRSFVPLLNLDSGSRVLEVGCGAGGCALYVARLTSADLTAIDIRESAIGSALALAAQAAPQLRVRFEQANAEEPLPFANAAFDAVFSNDAMCHLPRRADVLREWFRVLKPKGRMLFTDAMIITAPITNQQLALRSSIGRYLFVPPGENERLIREAGFELICATDTTPAAAAIARKWHDARGRRASDLIAIEGREAYESTQAFLACVRELSEKRILSRFLYAARKNLSPST